MNKHIFSLLKQICYPGNYKFKTQTTQWGLEHEKLTITSYYETVKINHTHLYKNSCGLVQLCPVIQSRNQIDLQLGNLQMWIRIIFLKLSHNLLCELFENNHLRVGNELQVFSAFLHWIDHNLDGCAQYAYDLLDCIRIALLPKKQWERIFNTHCLFQVSWECHAYLRGYLMGLYLVTFLCTFVPLLKLFIISMVDVIVSDVYVLQRDMYQKKTDGKYEPLCRLAHKHVLLWQDCACKIDCLGMKFWSNDY